MASVRIPATMRNATRGQPTITANGATVAEAFEAVASDCPALTARLFDAAGELHRYVAVFVNACDIRSLDGLSTELRENDEIHILSAIAGG
jgi:sulfur-carrier protein